MTSREARLARNEALFRGVNERIKDVRSAEADPGEPIRFICECGRQDCVEEIDLTTAQYEAVRSSAERFFIVPGHESPEVERVVERHDGYDVVEKHEEEAAIAREADPRDD